MAGASARLLLKLALNCLLILFSLPLGRASLSDWAQHLVLTLLELKAAGSPTGIYYLDTTGGAEARGVRRGHISSELRAASNPVAVRSPSRTLWRPTFSPERTFPPRGHPGGSHGRRRQHHP